MADDSAMEATSAPPPELDPEDLGAGDGEEIGKEIPLTADGGVIKKILVAGSGWEKPEKGDIVTVHYVGTLKDGTKFDASRDRNEPFTFNLGEGRVIKGWDVGVASMLKGEKCVLTCRADYAYGENGSPPKIPPGATLDFEVELLSWTSVKDIAGDGGVIKTIVTEGEGWSKPQDRDEVVVEYSAKVSGEATPFLSSGPEGVSFTVSDGLEGIKGIQVAVQTMKKGEHVTLEVKPEYAYGAEGLQSKVPPNANIEVDLKLLQIKKVEDVTDDGLVTKKTLIESEEWKRPNEGATVTVKLTGRLADGTVFLSYPEGSELTFVTDENQVPEGLDQAVMKMKSHEKALVTVPAQYAYGPQGRPLDTQVMQTDDNNNKVGQIAVVPPNETVTFEVELCDFENAKESWDMSDEEKVTLAGTRKEKANTAYREGKVQRAIRLYQKAVADISNDKTYSEDLRAKARELRRTIHLNLAAAHLKLQSWKEAASQAGKVLELESSNVKALYRRAQAFIGSGDYVEAEQDIKRGLVEEPNNADLTALMKKLKVQMRDLNKKEAAIFSKMFKSKPAAAKTSDASPAQDTDTKKTDTTQPQVEQDTAMRVDVDNQVQAN